MHLKESRSTNLKTGRLGEALAVRVLEDLGYRVLQRNWRCRVGEIDLVAWDDAHQVLAFVEVKCRRNRRFGGAQWAVNQQKYQRLRSLVGCWLEHDHSQAELREYKRQASRIRIDLLAVDIPKTGPANVTFTKDL